MADDKPIATEEYVHERFSADWFHLIRTYIICIVIEYFNWFSYRVAQEPSFEKLSEISDESNVAFHPVLYNFRTPPTRHSNSKKHALQLPFAVLFDNLITVLWAVYGKNPRVMCGKSYNYRRHFFFYRLKINSITITNIILQFSISKQFLIRLTCIICVIRVYRINTGMALSFKN